MLMTDKIKALDDQIKKLQERKNKMLAKAQSEVRKKRTRQAVILGAWLIEKRPDLVEQIKAQLVRPQDLAAFGIEAKKSPEVKEVQNG